MGFSEKELKRDYPNLYREISSDSGSGHSFKVDRGRGYDPSIIDFLQRCSTDAEGLEVIDFMEKRGEISKAYAASLRKRIAESGIRSFGEKRESGYYFKKFG
ncbi:MAG: DUF2095 family protein [Candidatus Methanosuratincola petrocarbonis]|nr:DUF2095 family protein [Candidatus Methanosuratincola sp.]